MCTCLHCVYLRYTIEVDLTFRRHM